MQVKPRRSDDALRVILHGFTDIPKFFESPGIFACNAPDNNHGQLLSGMIGIVKRGELKPKISAVYDLENLSDAHEDVEKGIALEKLS